MHLVAVDFSDDSKNAIRYAFQETSSVIAAHVITGLDHELWQTLVEPPAEIGERVLDKSSDALREFVEPLAPKGATVRTIATFGSPYKELLAIAERESPDIVWCGRSSKNGLVHAAVGSTVFRLASHLQTPIGVIGSTLPDAIETIIVPFDLSNAGESAIRFAQKRSDRSGAKIRIVHAISHTTPVYATSGMFGMPTAEDLIDARENLIRVRRARIENVLGRLDIKAEIEFSYAPPADAVADVLVRYPNAEVVMAQRCRDLKRFVLGSVTERVLKKVHIPVFVVPAHSD